MRLRNVEVNWTKPMKYENAYYDIRVDGIGIYYISRKFGSGKTLLYIGKTHDCFYNRLLAHDENWLNNYRGQKYVGFGNIVSPKSIEEDDFKTLIKDIESALIYELQSIQNTMSTSDYNFTNLCKIHNTGYLGTLPHELSMRNHM